MKWIVIAILAVIIPYTYITLRYRKPGKAFEPYHDMKERAQTVRLLSAGFQRVSLKAELPVDVSPSRPAGAAVSRAPGGLPQILQDTLLDKPLLAAEIDDVHAAPVANTLLGYTIELRYTQPDHHQHLGGAEAYLQGDEIWIAPELEKLHGDLLARNRQNAVRLTFPAGSLKPGTYRVTALGTNSSRAWTLQVK